MKYIIIYIYINQSYSKLLNDLFSFLEDIFCPPLPSLNFYFSYFTNNLNIPTLLFLFDSKSNPNFFPNLSYNK